MIRLSLIIATYNRARPLLEALESVVAQDAPPALWECVVVNNNSQDDTEARFADFAARHPAFALRMVREPRQGLSHARNCGIAAARGEYLAIIDDDERINPGFVAAYIRFFDTHPDAVAVTTEKDAVKLTNRRKIPAAVQQKLYYVPIRVSFVGDSEGEFLRQIELYVRSNQKYSVLHPE